MSLVFPLVVTCAEPLHHMSDAVSEIRSNSITHTLVILDIDSVLIRPVAPMLCTDEGRDFVLSHFQASHPFTSKNFIDLTTSLAAVTEWQAIEETTPMLVQELQKENIAIMAITKAGNNCLFKWPYFPKYNELDEFQFLSLSLKKASFNIDQTSPQLNDKIQEVCDYLSVVYQDGILFTCGQPMSHVVPLFVSTGSTPYTKVIVISESMAELEELESAFKPCPIKLVTYRYSFGKNNQIVFDRQIAEAQLRHYQKTHSLLTNEQAIEKKKTS